MQTLFQNEIIRKDHKSANINTIQNTVVAFELQSKIIVAKKQNMYLSVFPTEATNIKLYIFG